MHSFKHLECHRHLTSTRNERKCFCSNLLWWRISSLWHAEKRNRWVISKENPKYFFLWTVFIIKICFCYKSAVFQSERSIGNLHSIMFLLPILQFLRYLHLTGPYSMTFVAKRSKYYYCSLINRVSLLLFQRLLQLRLFASKRHHFHWMRSSERFRNSPAL